MGRTFGAKDLKKRKIRSDRKHKYVQRKGKFVPYKTKRQRGDPIKLWFWQRIPMSKQGRLKWNKKLRPHIKPMVTLFHVRVDVDPQDISNVEKIKELALTAVGHEGIFLLMGFSHGKNKFKTKPVKLCRIVIVNTREGLKVRVTELGRLSRYWFWEK